MRFSRLAWLGWAVLALGTGCGGPGSRNHADLPGRTGTAQVQEAFARGEKLVAVDIFGATNRQVTQLIEEGFDFWAGTPARGAQKSRVRGALGPATWVRLQEWGLSVVKLRSVTPQNSYDPKYRTYQQAMADMAELAQKYPDICRLVDLGNSVEGRPILSLKFGVGDTAAKPALLFSAENHARELATSEMALRLAKWLAEAYGTDAEATYAVENREIWVTPMVNPDGHLKAEGRFNWRKNTNKTYGGSGNGPYGPGVDLNRNYMSRNWGSTGTDTNPSGVTYGGPGPTSEPETQALSKLYAARKYEFLMTFHSFGNLVMWPWNDASEPPDDPKMPAIGMKLGELSGYYPEQGSELYYTSGDDTDHMWSEHKTFAYCIEVGGWGDGFDPPYSRIEKFWTEVHPMAKYLLNIAGNPDAVFGPTMRSGTTTAIHKRLPTRTGRSLMVRQAMGTGGRLGAPAIGWAR